MSRSLNVDAALLDKLIAGIDGYLGSIKRVSERDVTKSTDEGVRRAAAVRTKLKALKTGLDSTTAGSGAASSSSMSSEDVQCQFVALLEALRDSSSDTLKRIMALLRSYEVTQPIFL